MHPIKLEEKPKESGSIWNGRNWSSYNNYYLCSRLFFYNWGGLDTMLEKICTLWQSRVDFKIRHEGDQNEPTGN